jgi:hypothetical protein
MAVLSIDLATRRWSDLGIVVLDRTHSRPAPQFAAAGWPLPPQPVFSPQTPFIPQCEPEPWESSVRPIRCEMIAWNESGNKSGSDTSVCTGPVDAEILAGRINHLCTTRDIRIILLDGPQAWKSRSNGLEHSRVSERQLNTPAKTGLPGMVKPLTYRPFAEFCLDVYDALCRRGWRRLQTMPQPGSPQERVLVESYPHAAWKSLGLKPLVSKRRAKVSDLAEAFHALRSVMPITVDRPPNHDQLQAIVGGLAGLALEDRNTTATRIVGTPPHREDGHWREGFIVLPLPPLRPLGLRWLH